MKILYATTVAISMNFHKIIIRKLVEAGHTVDIATNEAYGVLADEFRALGCKVYQMSWQRSPLKISNITAIKAFRRIVQSNGYDIVHCHTPIAAACVRLACRPLRQKGLKIIYTAHGFHFFKGAPLMNWILYCPVEWLCSFFTDAIVTINREDADFARRHLHAKKTHYILGVGIDTARFAGEEVDTAQKRRELQVPQDAFLLLSVGELDQFKNHEAVVKAMPLLPAMHYVVAGEGPLHDHLTALAQKLGVADRVHLLGFRRDVAALYKTADVFVFPSLREGLPAAMMEAMAAGLPVVCSNIRGNHDLIFDASLYCHPFDEDNISGIIRRLAGDPALCRAIGQRNAQTAKKYDSSIIDSHMMQAYQEVLS